MGLPNDTEFFYFISHFFDFLVHVADARDV